MWQPPASIPRKAYLITGEPWGPTAQGHHWDALQGLEPTCGPYNEAAEGGGSQEPLQPEAKPMYPLGISVGVIICGRNKGTSRSSTGPKVHRPKAYDLPLAFVLIYLIWTGKFIPMMQIRKSKQGQGILIYSRSQIKLPSLPRVRSTTGQIFPLSPAVYFLEMQWCQMFCVFM